MIQKLHTYDSAEKANSVFVEKYKFTIFDFAYLLAIALNEKFAPQKCFGLPKKEVERLKNILERTKEKIANYFFLEELKKMIDGYLQYVERSLRSVYKTSGTFLNEKTKIILLWTYILRKIGRLESYETPSIENEKKMIKAIKPIEEVDWNNYYDLLGWFYSRLKNCSYSSYIKPKSIKKDEIKHAKSLWEKNKKNYELLTMNEIVFYRKRQKYLDKGAKVQSTKIGRKKDFYIKTYPIILIKFNNDSIKIGELRDSGIMIKKIRFIDKQKILQKDEFIKKKPESKVPIVAFPNGEEFTVKDYVFPLSISSYIDGFVAGLFKKSE